MKRINLLKGIAISLAIAAQITSYSQNKVVPVVGPYPYPIDATGRFPLGVSAINTELETYFRDSILPIANQRLSQISLPPTVEVSVKYKINQLKPGMATTDLVNSPNQRFVKLVYKVVYTLHIDNLPNRQFYHYIDINIKCKDWWKMEGGLLDIEVIAPTPTLVEPSLVEDILDQVVKKITLGFISYSGLLSNEIKRSLPTAIRRIIDLEGITLRCNCLSVNPSLKNNETGFYEDAIINVLLKKLTYDNLQFKGIKVKLESIKRLTARDENLSILYDEEENIYVTFFANMKNNLFEFNNFKEGEVRQFEENVLIIENPKDYESLLILAEIFNRTYNVSDNSFKQYMPNQNYGNGTKKIIVQKMYSERIRLPGGGRAKPRNMYSDAYEITFRVASFANRPPAIGIRN